MTMMNKALTVTVVYLTLFIQSGLDWLWMPLGTRIDLLPAVIVYVSTAGGVGALILTSLTGGLLLDSISANPLGASVLPMFLTGFLLLQNREFILRDQVYAQFCLGLAAGLAVPILKLPLLYGYLEGGLAGPLIGWGSIWHWSIMGLGAGAATPLVFWLFERLNRTFDYQPAPPSGFRPDREIKRGRT